MIAPRAGRRSSNRSPIRGADLNQNRVDTAVFSVRRHVIGAAIAALVGVLPATASATPIGTVVEIVNLATRQLPGQPKLDVRLADSLFPNELLETAIDARLKVDFIDGSILTLGPDSQAVLDRDLVDMAADSKPMLNLHFGTFLFSSEYRGAERMGLRSPVTNIDLRGTSLQIVVAEDGATEVAVSEGAVFLKPSGAGRGVLVEAGQVGRVDSPDSDVVVTDLALIVPAAGEPHPAAEPQPAEPASDSPAPDNAPDSAPDNTPDATGPDSAAPGSSAPGQNNGTGNNSGHTDGSNPGKGDANGKPNGGSQNPGK